MALGPLIVGQPVQIAARRHVQVTRLIKRHAGDSQFFALRITRERDIDIQPFDAGFELRWDPWGRFGEQGKILVVEDRTMADLLFAQRSAHLRSGRATQCHRFTVAQLQFGLREAGFHYLGFTVLNHIRLVVETAHQLSDALDVELVPALGGLVPAAQVSVFIQTQSSAAVEADLRVIDADPFRQAVLVDQMHLFA